MVGQGLAMGMEQSEPMVAAAAAGLGQAVTSSFSVDGGAGSGDTLVKVFIGDKELTDIVDYQIEKADAASGSFVMTGRRL
jgi:hypothetical protein